MWKSQLSLANPEKAGWSSPCFLPIRLLPNSSLSGEESRGSMPQSKIKRDPEYLLPLGNESLSFYDDLAGMPMADRKPIKSLGGIAEALTQAIYEIRLAVRYYDRGVARVHPGGSVSSDFPAPLPPSYRGSQRNAEYQLNEAEKHATSPQKIAVPRGSAP